MVRWCLQYGQRFRALNFLFELSEHRVRVDDTHPWVSKDNHFGTPGVTTRNHASIDHINTRCAWDFVPLYTGSDFWIKIPKFDTNACLYKYKHILWTVHVCTYIQEVKRVERAPSEQKI